MQAVGDLSSAAAAAAAAAREHASSPLCVAITGSKGSGKSAFARLLVNSLLNQGHGVVAYLDLDPGQPEFTPPVSATSYGSAMPLAVGI
jgi:polynucleotide 5'-kinase involved in rRNA processing